MLTFTPRQLAAIMILSASAALAPSSASEGPADAPPKPYVIPSKGIKDYIRAAIESPARPADMTVHDFYRKPAELLASAEVRPGSRVVELSSYGNYYSTLLSSVVGDKGELHMYDMTFFGDQVGKAEQAFVAAHKNATYENVDFNKIEFPHNVDVVMCVTCFHEMLLTGVDLSPFLAKLYKAMKPGATFMIVFYTARDGTSTDDTGKLHRIDPSVIKQELEPAGFTLYQEDRYLNNPADDKTWPIDTDARSDLADRTVYKFRK